MYSWLPWRRDYRHTAGLPHLRLSRSLRTQQVSTHRGKSYFYLLRPDFINITETFNEILSFQFRDQLRAKREWNADKLCLQARLRR